MAWVRPKHPKRKVEVDPTEALRPVLEYFSCSRPNASNSNNKELVRIPKKPLLLHDSFEPRPQKNHYEEFEQHQEPDHHHQIPEYHPRSEHHPRSAHHPRPEHHQRVEHHPRTNHHAEDYDRGGYHERASQRSTSHYTREYSPPPPRQPPLQSYRSNARPGAHLRLMPSRTHITTDTYTSRRPASRWTSATTPLEM